MTQFLTIHDVITAAREAYHAGTLQAQVMPGTEDCTYFHHGEGCVCAIGAALTPETQTELEQECLNEGTTLTILTNKEILMFPDDAQIKAAAAIQEVHDAWCNENWIYVPNPDYEFELGRDVTGEDFLQFLNLVEEHFK